MSEQNKAIVRRIVEDHWNQKNGSLAGELFADEVALYTPDGDLLGVDGAIGLYNAYANAFPDFRLRADDVIAEGDRVVVRYTFLGTHRGQLADIAPTGRPANAQGIVIFRLAGGKANEVRFVWDKYALLQQLGALPQSSPASAGVAS